MNVKFTRRLVILVGGLFMLGLVNALATEFFPPGAFLLNAGGGYAFAILVRKYW